MANKKVFTNLQFEGNAELKFPRVHPDASAPASKGPGQVYFDTGIGGTLNLQFAAAGATKDWKAVLTSGVAFTTNASVGFTADPPFTVGNSTKIAGLNADLLDGRDTSDSATANTIPIYGTNGILKVGTPVADDDAAPKVYVDNAVQGLDHKESVRFTTTGNIGLTGLGQGNVDGTHAAGDRILVKDQDDSFENGIYIAKSTGVDWVRATDADETGYSELTDFTSAGTSSGWSATDADTAVWDNTGVSSPVTYFTPVTSALTAGKTYRVKLTISNYSGSSTLGFGTAGGVSSSIRLESNTSTEESFIANGSNLQLFGRNTNSATIDVSVKETDLTEGAFVFVEGGTTKANTSWVLSDIAEDAWTQFSGAGQLAVTSNGAASTAPLTKSGDTIDFRYSLDNALSTTSAVSLVDPAASVFTSGVYNWNRYNSNTIANVGNTLEITWANNQYGAYVTLRDSADLTGDLVVGKKYRLTADAFYTGGSSGTKLQVGLAGSNIDSAVLTTSSVTYTIDFTADTATGAAFRQAGMGTGNVVTIDNWNLYELDALTVKSGGIDTVHLADDAVEPAQLQDTGAFQMAKLGVGVVPSASHPGLTVGSATNGMELDLVNGFSGRANTSTVRAYARTASPAAYKDLGLTGSNIIFGINDAVKMTLNASGKLGIGQDATSPSGTLHVSTARYGSSLKTGDNSDYSVADVTASTGSKYGWTRYGATTIGVTSEQLVINYVDHDYAAYSYFRAANGLSADLVAGRVYKVTVDLKYTGTGTAPVVRVHTGGGFLTAFGTLTTSQATYTETFTAATATTAFMSFVGLLSGQSITVDNFTIQEDNLAAGVDSDGNDLVVSGKDETGISIISQANTDAGIYFGDGLSDAFSKILSKRALDGTGTLKLDVNSATAIEIDSSQNVKIPTGGLGVGAGADTDINVKLLLHSADNTMLKLTKTYSGSTVNVALLGDTGSTAYGNLLLYSGTDASYPVKISAGSASFFNGGNVAIGGTTASELLHLYGAAPSNSSEALAIRFHNTGGGSTGANTGDAEIQLWEGRDADATALKFACATGVGVLNTVLTLDSDGQNHGGFPTVNSSTVQGLQDGAAYDFDGSSGKITSGKVEFGTSDFSYGCWVKFDSFVAYSGLVCNRSTTSPNIGTELRIGASSTNLELFTDFGSSAVSSHVAVSTLSTGRWYHIVAVLDRSDKQSLYIDGVLMDSDSISSQSSTSITNDVDLLIGKASAYHNGQIRDVKIFTSALTEPDVRKLYSGENPKKNLNVELVANGDFASGTGWTPQTGWTISGGAAHAVSAANNQQLYQTISLTTGKSYRVTFTVSNLSAGGVFVYVSSSATYSPTFNTNGTHSWVAVADGINSYISLRTSGTSTFNIDNVSVTEVTTLVDFNSRSASSETWYNAAIPSLYNGSLEGGVTLSAGSTDHRVDGALDVNGALTVDDLTLDGSTIDSTGDVLLDAATGYVKLKDSGTEFGRIYESSSRLVVQSMISDADLLFSGVDNGTGFTALTLDMSAAGAATFNAGVTATTGTFSGNIATTATSLTGGGGSVGYSFGASGSSADAANVFCPASYTLAFGTSSVERMRISSGGEVTIKKGIRGEADDKTVLLIHSDTTDGSTTFVDSSPSGHAITSVGANAHRTANKKFGATSIEFVGDSGSNGAGATAKLDIDSVPALGTGDWTIDCWVRFKDLTGSYCGIAENYSNSATGSWILATYASSKKVGFYGQGSGGISWVYGNTVLAVDTWYHVAVVHSSQNLKIYLNGVNDSALAAGWSTIGSGSSGSPSNTFARTGVNIGASHATAKPDLDGYLDEFRISKGVARWSSDFTPPARPYSTVNDETFNDLEGISKTGIDLVSGVTTQPIINLVNTNDDANGGQLVFKKTTLNEADSDYLGNIRWKGSNSTGEDIEYAEIYGQSVDITNGTEDGVLRLRTMSAGTLGSRLTVSSADTKVHGKLGVGGDPDDNHDLLIANTANYGLRFTGTNGTIKSDTNLIVDTTHNVYLRPTSGYQVLIDSGDGLAVTSGNCGIGCTDPTSRLTVEAASSATTLSKGGTTLMLRGANNVGKYSHIGFLYDSAGDYEPTATVGIQITDWAGHTKSDLVFGTRDSTNNIAPTERLRIKSDGTQDHYGNRIVNSQTVSDLHRTAEPSLNWLDNNEFVNLGTTHNATLAGAAWTVSVWMNFKGAVDGTTNYHIFSNEDYNDYGLRLKVDGSTHKIDLRTSWTGDNSAATVTANNIVTPTDGWRHVTVTRNAAAVKIYLDGVDVTVASGSHSTDVASSLNLFIGGSGSAGTAQNFEGEIKDFRIHNRALDSDEVAAAYNGESTPFERADADSDLYNGNDAEDSVFSGTNNGVWSTAANNSVSGGVWQITQSTTSDGTNLDSFGQRSYLLSYTGNSFKAGKKYSVTFEIKGTAGNKVYVNQQYAGGNLSTDANGGSFTLVGSDYAFYTAEFVGTYSASSNYVLFAMKEATAVYIKSIKIYQSGEVAAYTPQSIEDSGQWYDTTSNANHGTISGATSVNNPLNYGQFRAVGKSDSANLLKLSNRNKGLNDYTRIVWEVEDGETNSTALYEPAAIQFKTTDKDAPKGRLEFAVADTGSYSAANDLNLVLDNDGSVTATSGASSNLKQVARVHSETITIPATGDARDTVTHNLGTSSIVLSVKESSAPYEDVEVHWKSGTHTDSQTGDKATIYFASNPSSDTNYAVTVIG